MAYQILECKENTDSCLVIGEYETYAEAEKEILEIEIAYSMSDVINSDNVYFKIRGCYDEEILACN